MRYQCFVRWWKIGPGFGYQAVERRQRAFLDLLHQQLQPPQANQPDGTGALACADTQDRAQVG